MNSRKVTVCGIPHEMSIVDGGVMFSNKSGFWGVTGRIMFERKNGLWWITNVASTFGVPLCHFVKMATLLEHHIDPDYRALAFRIPPTEPTGPVKCDQ